MKKQKEKEVGIKVPLAVWICVIILIIIMGWQLVKAWEENKALKKQVADANITQGVEIDFWCHKDMAKFYMNYQFPNQETAGLFADIILKDNSLNCEVLK